MSLTNRGGRSTTRNERGDEIAERVEGSFGARETSITNRGGRSTTRNERGSEGARGTSRGPKNNIEKQARVIILKNLMISVVDFSDSLAESDRRYSVEWVPLSTPTPSREESFYFGMDGFQLWKYENVHEYLKYVVTFVTEPNRETIQMMRITNLETGLEFQAAKAANAYELSKYNGLQIFALTPNEKEFMKNEVIKAIRALDVKVSL